jgi:hypothetical protein
MFTKQLIKHDSTLSSIELSWHVTTLHKWLAWVLHMLGVFFPLHK